MRLKEFVINELTQAEIEKIARDAGISSALLDKRLDQESNKQHYDKTGKVKIGDKHMQQKAHGIGQVRQPALDDINADYGTNYTIKDLQNPAKNAKISALYLKLAKEKYASKFAPGKDAEAYANLAYQYGPDVPPDLVKNLPAGGSKKPLYNPIKAKSTMPTQGQGMGAKDAYDQTMADPAVKQKIDTMKQAGSNLYQMGKDLIGGKTTLSKATDFENLTGKIDTTINNLVGTDANIAKNIAQGNINKDSWAYKNIVAPFMKGAKGYSDSFPNYYK